MRPKDLKNPNTWQSRAPAIVDNVLFVPTYYQAHESFEMPEFNTPLSIEYCSGNGEWIALLAEKNPDKTYIAVEMQFPRVRKIWSKSQNRGLKNLFIVCGAAQDFTKYYLQTPCVDHFYVNFPDPWPKKRHAKHRLIQTPFIDEMTQIASSHAKATFVTDDLPYATQMRIVMQSHPSWTLEDEQILKEGEGESFFDRLWRSKGRSIYKLTFTRA